MKLTKLLATMSLCLSLVLGTTLVSATDVVISTGTYGGGYAAKGEVIANNISIQAKRFKVDLNPSVISSNGTIENIQNLNDGIAQVAIVQADGLSVYPLNRSSRSKESHKEYVFWLYNEKYGITDLGDIEGNEEYVIVAAGGSGAFITLSSFAKEDSGYEVNLKSMIAAEDNYDAAEIASQGVYEGKKVAGMLYVGSQVPHEIAQDFKSTLMAGEAVDSDFNDAEDAYGSPLYSVCEIAELSRSGMRKDTWGNPSTICMKALVVYLTDVGTKQENKAVSRGISKATR